MDPLQRRHVDEAGALAASSRPGAWKRVGSAWKPPSVIVLAPHATRSPPRRILRTSLCVLNSCRTSWTENSTSRYSSPATKPSETRSVAHRVDEGAAELAVLGALAQRPAHRVDDVLERLRHLPDLLDAERPDLRLRALEPEARRSRRRSGVPACPPPGRSTFATMSEPGSKVAERLALPAAALVARADPVHAAVARRAASGRPSRAGPPRRPPPPARRGSGRAARPRRPSCRGCASSAAAGSAAPCSA